MSDLRNHSQPCDVCGNYTPLVAHGLLEPEAVCTACDGAGGRKVTATEALEWALAQSAKIPAIRIPMKDDDE